MESAAYAGAAQPPYSSPLYLQQVFQPQLYPLYNLLPPSWSPSPAPYFETPLVRKHLYGKAIVVMVTMVGEHVGTKLNLKKKCNGFGQAALITLVSYLNPALRYVMMRPSMSEHDQLASCYLTVGISNGLIRYA